MFCGCCACSCAGVGFRVSDFEGVRFRVSAARRACLKEQQSGRCAASCWLTQLAACFPSGPQDRTRSARQSARDQRAALRHAHLQNPNGWRGGGAEWLTFCCWLYGNPKRLWRPCILPDVAVSRGNCNPRSVLGGLDVVVGEISKNCSEFPFIFKSNVVVSTYGIYYFHLYGIFFTFASVPCRATADPIDPSSSLHAPCGD